MRKLNKSEAQNAGQTVAANSMELREWLAGLDLAAREKMEWMERDRVFRQMVSKVARHTSYEGAFEDGFTSKAHTMFAEPLRARETARKQWQRALNGITYEDAVKQATDLLRSFNVRGSETRDSGWYLGLRVTRQGVGSADVDVRWERDYDNRVTNPDNERESAGRFNLEVKVNWSSFGSASPSAALAAAKLHREVAEVAAEVEAALRDLRVVWTYGIVKPEETAEVAVQE